LPNRDTWENNSSSPYPNIISEYYRFGIRFSLLTHWNICSIKIMVPRNNHDIWTHHDMVADMDGTVDPAIDAETRMIADR